MPTSCARACGGFVALVLGFTIVWSVPVRAQRAKVSFRVAPFGTPNLSPLFRVEIAAPSPEDGILFPSLTLTETDRGPQLTNLALLLPDLTIGETAIASRLGDQPLPGDFVSSPLFGSSIRRPMRGLSFSTNGATPWTVSLGQLDPGSSQPGSTGVAALAVNLARQRRLSVSPRLLIPMGAEGTGQASVGTLIRTNLNPHVSVVSDLAAADTIHSGWAPLASAALVGQWAGTQLETSVLRGARSQGAEPGTTIGTLDREVARARVQLFTGLTVAGGASWSRPATAHDIPDTKIGSVAVTYDALPYGNVSATHQTELSPTRELETTRVEWRHAAAGGFMLRYTETHATLPDSAGRDGSKMMEIDLPTLARPGSGGRLNLRAALTADASSISRGVTSRVRARLGVFENVALVSETEIGVARSDRRDLLRAVRFTTDVPILQDTSVQLFYVYRSDVPYAFDRVFEARVSRTLKLFR
jgi:hypothetical protein